MPTKGKSSFTSNNLLIPKQDQLMVWTKSGGKSQISLSFLSSTVNDIRKKLYMVGTYSTVEKWAKRIKIWKKSGM